MLRMTVRELLELVNRGGNIHLEYEWQQPTGWHLDLNKREKQAEQQYSYLSASWLCCNESCCLTLLPSSFPTTMDWTLNLWIKLKHYFFLTLFFFNQVLMTVTWKITKIEIQANDCKPWEYVDCTTKLWDLGFLKLQSQVPPQCL